jgi:hypothetical protein
VERHDQLTNAVACANLRYLKSKVAEPAKFKHGDPPLSLPEYRPSGARLVRDNGSVNGDETYEGVTCLACRQVHMVNPKTGKVLGADEETN